MGWTEPNWPPQGPWQASHRSQGQAGSLLWIAAEHAGLAEVLMCWIAAPSDADTQAGALESDRRMGQNGPPIEVRRQTHGSPWIPSTTTLPPLPGIYQWFTMVFCVPLTFTQGCASGFPSPTTPMCRPRQRPMPDGMVHRCALHESRPWVWVLVVFMAGLPSPSWATKCPAWAKPWVDPQLG